MSYNVFGGTLNLNQSTIQQLFQHSLQLECSPADVILYVHLNNVALNFTEF